MNLYDIKVVEKEDLCYEEREIIIGVPYSLYS